MGRKKFNMDPKKVTLSWSFAALCVTYTFYSQNIFLQGILFLVENDLLRHTPEDIAQFLYKGEGLNKTAIGDYLGERCVMLKETSYHSICPLSSSDL